MAAQERASKVALKPLVGWSHLQSWKSRLPLIVIPVLAGLGKLAKFQHVEGPADPWEFSLIFAIAAVTGFTKLPFSVTWWLFLVVAYIWETQLLVGVATVLSLSVLLGWYGVRFSNPHAISALWGGSRGRDPSEGGVPQPLWQAWDFFVHLLPCLFMLIRYGPLQPDGGIVTSLTALTALPVNVLWLWGLGLRLSKSSRRLRLWPFGMELQETNVVYCVEPNVPVAAWKWIYGSHWLACSAWAACLLLPFDVLFAYGIFALHGLAWLPFTNAWWAAFLIALFGSDAVGPTFRGIVACCAATVSIGWYGTQILLPYVFESLVKVWVIDAVHRFAPVLSRFLPEKLHGSLMLRVARVGDLFVHLFPTMLAFALFASKITPAVALFALPSNMIYWTCTRTESFEDTNKMYGVNPQPPKFIWSYIYGSHWAFCAATFCICRLTQG